MGIFSIQIEKMSKQNRKIKEGGSYQVSCPTILHA